MDCRVVVREADKYDIQLLQNLVRELFAETGAEPRGRVFLLADVPFSHYDEQNFGRDSYTNRILMEAIVRVLGSMPQVTEVCVAARAGMSIPTRLFFRWGNYYAMAHNLKTEGYPKYLEILPIEEDWWDEVFIGGRIHSTARIPRRFLSSDYRIYAPKLKEHSSMGMAGASYLNLALLAGNERFERFDYSLADKVADIAGVCRPDLVMMDAVNAGVGFDVLPTPKQLGLVLAGRTMEAVDSAAARVFGFGRPEEIPYLGLLKERFPEMEDAFKPDVRGAAQSAEELGKYQSRLGNGSERGAWKDLKSALSAAGSPVRVHHGPIRRKVKTKCHAGCARELGFMFLLAQRYRLGVLRTARPLHVIIGAHEEPVDCGMETAILAGSCAEAKTINVREVVRINQCPVSALRLSFALEHYAGISNPFLDVKFIAGAARAYLATVGFKTISLRYVKDVCSFFKHQFTKTI